MSDKANPSQALANWVHKTRYDELPAEVRQETLKLLYDQVGGMLPSSQLPSCRPVIEMVKRNSTGSSTIIGHAARVSLTDAALANGTIGHGTEVDATGQHRTGHYAASVVPAALTVGQHVNASGEQLCRAIALGAEVAARMQSVVFKYDTRKPFATTKGATMGAGAAAGLLLGLNAEQLHHALALTADGASGLMSSHFEPTHQIKSLHHGRATHAGVQSALLARQGLQGPPEPFTCEDGFFDGYVGMPEVGHEVIEGLGSEYRMRQIMYKRYPVGGPNQTPAYGLLQLMRSNGIQAQDIERIEAVISQGAFLVVTHNEHPSVHLPTILAMAVVHGDINFSVIHDPQYAQDPRVRKFLQDGRLNIVPRQGVTDKSQRLNMSLSIRTRDGKVFSQELRYPLMSDEEIERKFRFHAGLRLARPQVDRLEDMLRSMDRQPSVQALMSSLEIPSV